LCLLTEDNDNPIIIRPHIVFTDGRQQRQPNQQTINPIIIRPHCIFTDRRQQRQPNHNTTTYCCGRIMIGLLLLSSVSKHTIWSYYDWIYCCCRPSVNTICGRIMIGLSLLSSVSKHTMWSYYDWVYCLLIGLSLLSSVSVCLLTDDNNDNTIIIRPHIVFTDGRQQQ
jgi:FtsH-binding integral membrane protein